VPLLSFRRRRDLQGGDFAVLVVRRGRDVIESVGDSTTRLRLSYSVRRLGWEAPPSGSLGVVYRSAAEVVFDAVACERAIVIR
jgi:hypothetical protein